MLIVVVVFAPPETTPPPVDAVSPRKVFGGMDARAHDFTSLDLERERERMEVGILRFGDVEGEELRHDWRLPPFVL